MAFEHVVLAYLALFVVVAPFTRAPRRRRTRTALTAGALAAGVWIAMRTVPLEVRLWLPLLYLPAGYWLPAPLVLTGGGTVFEAWLQRTEATVRAFSIPWPRWIHPVAELGYLACYPLVPAALAIVWIRGTSSDVADFWLAVLVAGYACYATLPWLVSRPPRCIEHAAAEPAPVARVNLALLDSLSHRLVTFPSAHVAIAVAAALTVARVWMPGGLALALVAAGVAAGAVAGRYHFAVDVALGVAVGVLAAQL